MKNEILCYCEDHGIYEIYSVKGNVITYYSFYGWNEGFVKVTKNVKTGEEKRKRLRYKRVPKFLKTPEGWTKYNYFCG